MPKSQLVDFRAVKSAVTMQQVLEHYRLLSTLQRSGDSLSGPCPIHGGDNETAFRVSISKNCWNCFSRCASGGNVLDFVAKMEKVSILKAANMMVEWFSLTVPLVDRSASLTRPQATAATDRATAQAASPPAEASLTHTAPNIESGAHASGNGNQPLEFTLKNLQADHPYLRERGLSLETVATFGIGLCAKGLLKDRIAIPIHNPTGQLVAYAGRWPGPKETEKYQFPKGFKKSEEIFNLHRALAEPSEAPMVIVEGFFDTMRLHQVGIRRVVALMGCHLSEFQESLLRKHTVAGSRLLLMLDEDDAGRAARDAIACRLARFAFVGVHTFSKTGMQPDQLTSDEAQSLKCWLTHATNPKEPHAPA